MLPVVWVFFYYQIDTQMRQSVAQLLMIRKKQTPVLGKKDQNTETYSALKVEQDAAF